MHSFMPVNARETVLLARENAFVPQLWWYVCSAMQLSDIHGEYMGILV